jgi:hypothetical protein
MKRDLEGQRVGAHSWDGESQDDWWQEVKRKKRERLVAGG